MSYDAPPPPPADGSNSGGYGQQPPPPPPGGGYGQPGGYAQPPNHPKAVTALVLGILGLVCCGPIGIAGYIVGKKAVDEIDASGGQLGGRGMAQAGKICGLIAIVLMVIGIIVYGLLFATGSVTTDDFTTTGS